MKKSSRYFFALEKSNYNKKVIVQLKLENGAITQDPEEILQAELDFYSTLYTSNKNISFGLINTTGIKVSQEMHDLLEKDVTLDEIKTALFDLKSEKTPGCDGFTAEFFKCFWEDLASLYMEMLLRCISKGHMNASTVRGVISLIPKKGPR